MIALTAAEVALVTGGALHAIDPSTVVAGPVVTDSREVIPGALFVAIAGEHSDGHAFAARAVAAGACAVLAAHEVVAEDGTPVPAVVVPDVVAALGALAREVLCRLREAAAEPGGSGLRVVAVTGSVGKTTTKDLLLQVLGAAGPTVAPVRSFNNEIGLPLTVLRADEDTRYLVLEMGASGIGHIAYLTDIAPPDVAIVLVVGRAHVGEFGGIEATARAKSELVTGLVPDGVAVLNADDARVAAMADLAPDDVVTFGLSPAAQVRATDVRLTDGGHPQLTLVDARGAQPRSVPVRLRLVGEHHVHNALAAAAAALVVGLDLEAVADGLAGADALSPHRMHVADRPDGVTVVDDSYNANPDSMRAALKALAALAGRDRRSVAVLGEMLELGPEARSAHDAVGRLAVRLDIGLTVVVGAGARAIADGAAHEGSWGDEVVLVDDVDAAAALLDSELRPGDVVLVKSSYGAGLWRLGDRLLGVGA
ncbi:MAG: UDP-N-acetylmuramoyl-tripeptide--D-alanyl-D-alanine ligase [Cellulomonas sp. 73-92]|uniref:UDP-N-acetylmuramoyl-tripeptide--D-alanyl-D- alanine ligase n=1 Tax=Cellulomonas sp. 73-92 TaxID=1895740 RepID=UPI0009260E3A|nr:UDP-N-acetylmuramoyl-tripeptide--D-alanyl-D-alanine ligase [Cellulomonas sp. 73-92]OJV79714.1 MAG: UDP-N-acetylmuramoyl-tripeptide--D-alanyl-D-alanine ligase [Cellulomonas sp. 73-92]